MAIFLRKDFLTPRLPVTKLDVIIINTNYTNEILNVPNDNVMLLSASELIIIKRIYQTNTAEIKRYHFLKDLSFISLSIQE